MSRNSTPIGIAVVEHDNAFLIGRRDSKGPLPNADEFPGGKCLPGESFRDGACRECVEETGIRVFANELLLSRTFDYSHGRVELHFWHCRLADESSADQVRSPHRWVPRSELSKLALPEANEPVVKLLIARGNTHAAGS